MKKQILVLLLLLIAFPIRAQTYGWKKVAQLGTGLQTLFFLDSIHGWAANGASEIYRTTDGGNSWVQYGSNAGFGVKAISFSDSLNGWIVGTVGNGFIIRTTDGGKTWFTQLEKPERSFLATHSFNSLENITSGEATNFSSHPDTGKIVETFDGGKTWVEKTPFDNIVSYNKIQFLNSLNGFICGYPILRTRDGGKTWKALPPDARIGTPYFIDTLHGWGGYNYAMYHTIDGGETWSFLSFLDQPDQLTMNDIAFTDSLNGWAFGFQFYLGIVTDAIYRTTDGGNNWYRESVALTKRSNHINQGQMYNKYLGWAVCGNGEILRYDIITSVVEKLSEQQPKTFTLRQNYPNPFNPTTTIEYELQSRQTVSLSISDALGKRVETILNNEQQDAGVYRVRFDGRSFSSGAYFYTIKTEAYTDTKQMILIK